jgi:thioredoxin 1
MIPSVITPETLPTTGDLLLYCWSPSCAPCMTMIPVVQEFARQGIVSVGKLNIQEHLALAQDLGVLHLPTIIFIREGESLGGSTLLRTADEIKKWVEKFSPRGV